MVGKGNKAAKISGRDDCINIYYLTSYRRHLELPALPSPQKTHPLISTLVGRAGLSVRYLCLLLQQVFDRALQQMVDEGWRPAAPAPDDAHVEFHVFALHRSPLFLRPRPP